MPSARAQQQISLVQSRLPLLRAAAKKNFDVCVVDENTGEESPFDLYKTFPGCLLNIRWKDPNDNTSNQQQQDKNNDNLPSPSSMGIKAIKTELESLGAQSRIERGMEKSDLVRLLEEVRSSSTSFSGSNLKSGEPGVREFHRIKYLDSPSVAYELHSLIVSKLHAGDAREVAFLSTKILKGSWLYIALAESDGPCELGELSFFWSMVLHFHRTGECLPPSDPEWTEKNICFNRDLIARTLRQGMVDNKSNAFKIQSQNMGAILHLNHMTSMMKDPSRKSDDMPQEGDALYEKHRNNVSFTATAVEVMVPLWWRKQNELWTETLKRFIETGSAPCMWVLKEAGCDNKNLSSSSSTACPCDHTHFPKLVKNVTDLVRKSFKEQEHTDVEAHATGQGIELDNRDLDGADDATKQLKLKERGNEYVQKQDYVTAIKYYTAAININPNDEAACAIFSNRSLCHLNLDQVREALSDADMCIQLRPKWHKSHFRRGCALSARRSYDQALASFDTALSCEGADVDIITQFREEAEENRRRSLRLDEENSNKKKNNNNKKQQNDKDDNRQGNNSDASADDVKAVLFPADANRRPYQVKIPATLTGDNVEEIHRLLGISEEDIESLPAFLRKQKVQYPENFPVEAGFPYTMSEWLDEKCAHSDQEEENEEAEGGVLEYGFQPCELKRGENDKTNLIALINPQSKGAVNTRMCAILTEMDGKMNLTDADPKTCKCRGDALVVRFKKSDDEDQDVPYHKNMFMMDGSKRIRNIVQTFCEKRLGQFEQLRKSNKKEDQQFVAKKLQAMKKFGMEERRPAIFVQFATALNEVITDPSTKLIDFCYEDYDSVWGIFTHVMLPDDTNQFASSLLPNTPAHEKMLSDMMAQGLNRRGGGGGGGGGRRR